LLLAACGGGGGGGSSPAPNVPSTNAPTAPTQSTTLVTASASPSTGTFGTIQGGYSGSVTLPGTTSTGSASLVLSASNPSGPAVTGSARLPQAIGGALTPLAYVTLTASASLKFSTWPTFTFALPAGFALAPGGALYLAWNPGDITGNWSTLAGPVAVSGSTVTFTPSTSASFAAGTTYAFALLSTSQVLVPTTPPTPSPVADQFTCPTSGAPNSIARATASGEGPRRRPHRQPGAHAASATTTLAVNYDRSSAQANATQIASRERQLGVNLIHTFDFASTNTAMHVVTVPTSSVAQAEASLRSQAGVRSVSVSGERRYHSTSTPLYTNDPYFQGFAPNFEHLPYAESASVPGQWDMQAIGLENAYGYSQTGTTYTANPAALGSAAIKLAIIDTGEDASHPELSGKIAYQKCYITNAAGTQTNSLFSTDEDGHGTDVSGIAAAASGNGLGFTGAGGKTSIYAYRVFPTPDDSCASDTSADDACSSDTSDIAAAISDAIAQHVNVISMSLGGGGCTGNGVDTDSTEGAAVAAAIAANIIVVAAAGNGGTAGVTAPGCDAGVIAAGATSLDDGSATGTSDTGPYTSTRTSGATAANIVEYVASYSQWGSPSAMLNSSSAWGIVAPGGDPSNAELSGTADDLHWIENIWTSTPFVGSSGDQNFLGNCTPDFGTTSGPNDCRTLIAGTSMATPHVAGAAALILAVNSTFQSPTAMKALLCSTADDLSDSHQGCGRLNVYRAMAHAIGDTVLP
jgi:subtilisin family serine protease